MYFSSFFVKKQKALLRAFYMFLFFPNISITKHIPYAKMKNVAVLFYVYDFVSNKTEMVVPLFSSLSTAILP